MNFLATAAYRFRTLQANLVDLHDPQGVYWHRAACVCLATLVSAIALSVSPLVAFPTALRPLLVIASLCFVLTASSHDRASRPTTLLGSFGVVFFSTSLLILTQPHPLLQAALLIGLGFLVHYLPQFGAAFGGGLFVWILTLLASAQTPAPHELSRTALNLTLGWLIAYLCYFWIVPYRPHAIFLKNIERLRLRLATRLQQTVEALQTQPTQPDHAKASNHLNQQIVSLINAEETMLEQVVRRKRVAKSLGGYYRHLVAAHAVLFDAILGLEHSLLVLQSAPVPPQLQSGLAQLSQQAAKALAQVDALQALNGSIQFEAAFAEWLQTWVSAASSPETQIQRRNVQRAIQTLKAQLNVVVDLVLKPVNTTHG